MDMLGQHYVLKGIIQCSSHHFTVAVKDDSHKVYINATCVLVRSYTTFQDLLLSYPYSWFFAIFKYCSPQIYNNMQTISETSETVCQDSNLHNDTSLVDISYTIFDTSTSSSAFLETKSSATSFYAI